MPYSGPENRKHRRINKPIQLELKKGSDSVNKPWDCVFLKDISKSGLCFKTDEEYKLGEVYDFKLLIIRHTTIQCTAKVVRLQPLTGEYKYEVGFFFINLTEFDTSLIERVAKDFDRFHK